MKILYQSRTDIFDNRGGDTLQMEKTKEALEKLYKDIQIDISGEIYPENIREYDIVHVFNIDWICEAYPQVKYAKANTKPVVLSAIHHSEAEVLRYEKEARYDFRRIVNFFIRSQALRDTSKNIYRGLFLDHRKLKPAVNQLLHGIRKQQSEILKMADLIIVQTEKEAEDLKKDFKVSDFKWRKVVNGVDLQIFKNADKSLFKEEFYKRFKIYPKKVLVCVGRIEARKNQLNVAQAFIELKNEKKLEDTMLIFAGEYNKKQLEFTYYFKKICEESKSIFYMGQLDQSYIASLLKFPGIFINASWFETTGLVALEAAVAGMRPVVTGDRIKEYLGDIAVYCDPGDIKSLKNAILDADKMGKLEQNDENLISNNYNWENAAKQTYGIYLKLLN